MKINQNYTKKEIKQYREEHYPNAPFIVSFNSGDVFTIKFHFYEFEEITPDFFKCVKDSKEDIPDISIQVKSERKTRKYWNRDTQATRENKKWGYQANG